MYIRQVLKENSNRLIDSLKLVFTCIMVVILTFIFSIPHALALFGKMLEDAGADLNSFESIMTFFPKIVERLDTMDVADQMSILEPNLNLFLMLLGFCGMLLTVIICNKYVNGNSFLSLTTSRSKIDFSRIFFSFGLWSTISVVMIILGYFLSPESYVLNFNLIPFLILSLIVLLLMPIQTSAEEYVFRGYIIQNLGIITRNRWFPLIASSLLFGIIHGQNPEIEKFGGVVFIFYIGSGLFAGIMTLMDEGIELALGWHAANNITIALLVTADWTALQTDSILKDISNPDSLPLSEVLIPVLVFFPLVLYIFSKKYGWKDWSEKLLGKI